MPIKVLVVDDRAVVRAGVRQLCAVDDGIEVIGEADSWEGSRSLATDTGPDVVVIDLHQESGNGLQIVPQMRTEFPDLRILVFTDSDQWGDATEMMALGASGYLTKGAELDEIAIGIRCVYAGRIFISHSLAGIPSPTLLRGEPMPSSPALSGREREVIMLIADGLTNKQVAEQLFLSVKTIETYRSRIMKKHGLIDRAAMVRFVRSLPSELIV